MVKPSRLLLAGLLTLTLGALPLAAKWLPVHSVSSDSPIAVKDGDTGDWLTPRLGYSTSAWQEDTKQAFSHAVALADGNLYEFRLVAPGARTDDEINGLWDVYKNGVLACGGCVGKIYGLSQAAGVGNYFKIYVGSPSGYAETWHWSGYITQRFDY